MPEEAAFRRSYSLYDPLELAALISPELEPDVDDILGEHLEIYCDNFLPDHVNRMCLADSRMFLPGLNLTYTDRASMAASTEVRVPFVDPVVFRAAFSLTGDRKVSGRNGKVALKQAARAWLPDEIINRPKASFLGTLEGLGNPRLARTYRRRPCRRRPGRDRLYTSGGANALIADDRSGRQDRVETNLATAHTRTVVPAGNKSGRCRLGQAPPLRFLVRALLSLTERNTS